MRGAGKREREREQVGKKAGGKDGRREESWWESGQVGEGKRG